MQSLRTIYFFFLAFLSFPLYAQNAVGAFSHEDLSQKMAWAVASNSDEQPIFRADLNNKVQEVSAWFMSHPEYTYIGGQHKDLLEFGHINTYYGETFFVKTEQLSSPSFQYTIGTGYYENRYPYFCRASGNKEENEKYGLKLLTESACHGYVPSLLYCGTVEFMHDNFQRAKSFFYVAYNLGCEEAGSMIAMVEDKERSIILGQTLGVIGAAALVAGLVAGAKRAIDGRGEAFWDELDSLDKNEVGIALRNGVDKYITGCVIDRERMEPLETTRTILGEYTSAPLYFKNGIKESYSYDATEKEPYAFIHKLRTYRFSSLDDLINKAEDLVFESEMDIYDSNNNHFSYDVQDYMAGETR